MDMRAIQNATMETTTFSCGAGMDDFWMVMSSAILRRLVKVCMSLVSVGLCCFGDVGGGGCCCCCCIVVVFSKVSSCSPSSSSSE